MFFAESLKGIELDEIAHDTGPRFPSYRFEQAQFDPPGRLVASDPQVRADFAQAHCVRDEVRVFLTVKPVVETLGAATESKRCGVDAVIGDVFDQFVGLIRIESVPGYRPGPFDSVPGHEIPAGAFVPSGQGGQFFANGDRMFLLAHDFESLWRESPPRSAFWDPIDGGRRHTPPHVLTCSRSV
jgi:hypothetical protein